MKIKRIYLHRLRNEELFNFFSEFKTFVEEVSPGTLNIVEQFALFLALYAELDIALEKLRKSLYTTTIVSLDEQRDEVFRGLTAAVQSASHHFDPNMRGAAEMLQPLWEHYGNLAVKPFNEETAGIINFVQELRGTFAPAIQTLGLVEWVNELERRNNAFEALVLERNRDNAGKPDLNVFDLRRKIDRCYLDMVERIEAQILLQGEATFATFVKTLNTNIERYSAALNRRKGKGKNQNDENQNENE